MDLASLSSLNEATEKNNIINEEVEEDFTPMEKHDEASEGGLHLRENEFHVNDIVQMDV